MKTNHVKMAVSLLLAAGLTACGGGGSSLPGVSGPTTSQAIPTLSDIAKRSTSAIIAASSSYVAIDAGGSAAGAYGADTDYSGGTSASVSNAINTTSIQNPAPQSVYQTQRYAQNLTYTVPNLTPNALYNIRLHFVESFFNGSGQRIFGVKLNGAQALTNFDIFASAGGKNIAIAKTFTSKADGTGTIAINLAATVNNASIAAIEVSTAALGSTAPSVLPGVSIDAGGSASGTWAADEYYNGGWIASVTNNINTSLVTNPAPQAVYQSQRAGSSFSYSIPNLSPGGAYTVRLHFVESFWTSAGQRLFNVSLNGAPVLNNFDIYKAAGGTNVAIAEPFTTNADASGKITVSLSASVNNATLAGIEVIGGSASGPTPSPVTSPAPTPVPTPVVAGNPYTNYSALFTGNTPFHHKVATMSTAGVAVVDSQSSTEVNNWVNQISYSGSQSFWSGSPVYISKSSDPVYTWNGLNEYGGGNPLLGKQSHVPSYAQTQSIDDHHVFVEDSYAPSGAGEYGGFYCDVTSGGSQAYGNGLLGCGWGAYYLYGSSGLSADTSDVYAANVHGGYAAALGFLGQFDFYQAHHGVPISHALVMTASCTQGNTSPLYPASGAQTDSACQSSSNPTIKYGSLLHLKLNPSAIAATGASEYCRYILQAAADYGVYIADTTGLSYGPALGVPTTLQDDQAGLPDFVQSTVEPSLLAGGDGQGSPDSYPNGEGQFHWSTCLNRVWNASAWEAMHITTTTSGLPSVSNR